MKKSHPWIDTKNDEEESDNDSKNKLMSEGSCVA